MKRFRFESFMKFIIQSPKYGTFTEAARTDPEQYSHDTWRDDFINLENPQQHLWGYVQKYIDVKSGYLIADDTILDKPRGPKGWFSLFRKTQTFRTVSGQFGVDRWEICISR